LSWDQALPVLREFNRTKAQPPESDKQVLHKLDSAIKNCPRTTRDGSTGKWPALESGTKLLCDDGFRSEPNHCEVLDDMGTDSDLALLHWEGEDGVMEKVKHKRFLRWLDGRPLTEPPPDGLAALDESIPLVVCARDVTSRRVEYVWPQYIPYAFITMFAGRTAVGKSLVALDIVACKTSGKCWPEGDGEPCTPGNVLIISEDPHDFVLRPRLEAMGADLDRVYFMTWEAMAAYQLQDTTMLDRLVKDAGDPDLIIIDPPQNFLGKIDEHKNAEVRSVLMKIVGWLMKQDRPVALILNTQVTKGGKEVEAINRVLGSVAWTATSRVTFAFGPDKDTPGGVLFACAKNNLGPLPKTLRFRIVPQGDSAVVEWRGVSERSADEVMRDRPRKKRAAEAAAEFLVECFRQHLQWSSPDLFAEAQKRGISRNAVFEAKKTLNLPKCIKQDEEWLWWVSPTWPHLFDADKHDVPPEQGEISPHADKHHDMTPEGGKSPLAHA
jgi:hypothetical protein